MKSSSPRPRVLFIAPQPFFIDRGSPMRVRSTVTGLTDLGYEVDLLVYPIGDDIPGDLLRIHRCLSFPGLRTIPIGPSWRKVFCDVLLSYSAGSLALRRRYDVIHGVEEAAYIAAALARVKRVPYVFDMHSWVLEHLAHSGFIRSKQALRVLSSIEQWAIRNAGGIITVGDTITQMARGVAPGVPGCSLPDLPLENAGRVTEAERQRIRNEFQLEGKRTLLYTGNFAAYQGVELLLQSFAAFKKSDGQRAANTQPVLLIVGGGAPTTPDLVRLRELSQILDIASDVIFTGHRPESEMGAFMAAADILVSPRTEGTNPPLKIYSYMAAERPILATRISSHTQVLSDSCAILAEPTVEAFRAGLLRALDESETGMADKAQVVVAAKHLADTVYCRREFLRRLDTLYSAVRGGPLQRSPLEQPEWQETEPQAVVGVK